MKRTAGRSYRPVCVARFAKTFYYLVECQVWQNSLCLFLPVAIPVDLVDQRRLQDNDFLVLDRCCVVLVQVDWNRCVTIAAEESDSKARSMHPAELAGQKFLDGVVDIDRVLFGKHKPALGPLGVGVEADDRHGMLDEKGARSRSCQ